MTQSVAPIAPPGGFQNGGWYNGMQYFNGTFSAPGVINSQSPQQGAGQAVSNTVVAQTNPNNVSYIQKQQANPTNPQPAQPTQPSGGVQGSTGGQPLSLPQAPTFDLVAATNAAYNTPEIQAANKAITDRQQALADATGQINDNPFYSEATRVGKLSKLTSEANNDIQVQQDNLTRLHADAAIKVNAQQGQYNINEQAYKDNLTNFNNLLSSGGLDNASAADIANLAIQTGIPTSMIQSMASASRAKNNPVQLIQSTDNNGNLTLLSVDKSGNITNQTTIPGVAASKTGAGAYKPGSTEFTSSLISTMTPAITKALNSYGNISPQDWQQAKADWLSQGGSLDDFIKTFGGYADTNRADFQSAYGFKNPNPVWSTVYPGHKIGETFTDSQGNKITVKN
jgi:hypothetical protein